MPGTPDDPKYPGPDQTQPQPNQPPPNWGNAYPPPSGHHPYPAGPQKHPQSTTALVLGILSLVVCGLLGPFAWSIGAKAVKEIDAAPWTYGGRSEANAGRIMGIIGTGLLALSVLALVGLLVIGLAAAP
jgi:hypothetical protein